MKHILIIDDCFDAAVSLKEMILCLPTRVNVSIAIAHSIRDANRQLSLQPADLIFLDLHLPDGNGINLLARKEIIGNAKVILVTGHASVESAISALRFGAVDYIVKPVSIDSIKETLIKSLISSEEGTAEKFKIDDFDENVEKIGNMIGSSKAIKKVYQQLGRVAQTNVTVFIMGESGVGKEVVAQTLHELSKRSNREFLAVNCGAISPNLLESEVFGHEKGSFTGAEKQHKGFFEQAQGGTLFLDEVTEMPMDLQVKLLRVLETGQYYRVGSAVAKDADVRILAATNRCPHQAVLDGKLREDLLYRLNVFPINVPPLRERSEDVPSLANYFLAKICEQEGVAKEFSPEAMQMLCNYPWPGNVRELRNVVQRAYVMEPTTIIDSEWLPEKNNALKDEVIMNTYVGADSGNNIKLNDKNDIMINFPVGMSVGEMERLLIEATLKQCQYHKEKAASILGISLKTLYNRLKEYQQA